VYIGAKGYDFSTFMADHPSTHSSDMLHRRYVSSSTDDTIVLGNRIGGRCKGGEVIELVSDLGGGKTALVRGIAAGIGYSGEVTSPSFTINNTYQTDHMTIEHFDFYRIDTPGVMQQQLQEYMGAGSTITVIEWGDIVADVLPISRITIVITTTGESTRVVECSVPRTLAYIVEGIL
jgi:tRNA threonylcarbamoyladenosine biosynthesis protein TsaE